MVGYCEACNCHPLMPTVNDNVPGLIYSDKAVFTLSETACSEGQACRFTPPTIGTVMSCVQNMQCMTLISFLCYIAHCYFKINCRHITHHLLKRHCKVELVGNVHYRLDHCHITF
jgi:hypothetical protein